MRPEEFGPFLSALRNERRMTQAELAERLHVSTAAVSKWERGKCLPELSKLEDIAAVLGVGILEVLRCRRSDEPITEKSVMEVYTETASLSKAQANKKTRRWIAVLAAAAVFLVCCRYFPLYRVARVWYPSYYETGEISKLMYIGSADDRKTAQYVLAKAETAFSDLDTPRDGLEEKYGLLARYATPAEEGAAEETHSLRLWSARFDASYGCVWVYYTQETYDEEGNALSGSWNVPSLWYLGKAASGEWEVLFIKEHP
ncbi:MAG: helix-turn-helix domain-containing protein [Oscillospiraceae bacterium]